MERKTAQKAFSGAGQNDKKPRALFQRMLGAKGSAGQTVVREGRVLVAA